MKLSELVHGLAAVSGDLGADPEVFGVRHDSRRVVAGDLFVTWAGARHDGRSFAVDAIGRGAVAVLCDRPRAETGAAAGEVPWLVTEAPRRQLGSLAAALYGHPDRALTTVGVTGTNGKSTSVELVAAMLEADRRPTGRIGTLGYRFAGLEAPEAERTTPEASDLFWLLAEMRRLGARAVALEVSSHALEQGRVDGVGFDVAVFLNLTRDHLDYHGDLDAYFEAKSHLFGLLKPEGRAVVGIDDAYGLRLTEAHPGALSFGSEGAVAPIRVEIDARGLRGEIRTPRGTFEFESSLLGRYNLLNLLAAVAVGEVLGVDHDAVGAAIAATRPLPGRMEPVDAGQSFPALVDYAHTEAALEAAIRSLREMSGRKVIVVFGCGGDRDVGKRPRMGRIAGALAEQPIATSDNPRSEDPQRILSAIEEGLRASGNRSYRVVPDRREAIRRAVAIAEQGDWAVLVAGKGHEREQIVGEERLPFSDRDELEQAILERIGARKEG